MDNQKKISWLALIILVGFSLSVFIHYIWGMYSGKSYPYNTFLFRPYDRWMDFVWLTKAVPSPYSVPREDFQHFPFFYLIGDLLAALGGTVTLVPFLVVMIVFFAFTCLQNLRSIPRPFFYTFWFIFSFLSYPFLISIDRANLEILIYVLLYLFLFIPDSKGNSRPIFLGIAIAIKIFAAVFIIYQISQKRYKDTFWSLAIAGILTLISYAVMPGTIAENFHNNIRNLSLYNTVYIIGNEGLFFGNSLFGAIKFIFLWLNPGMNTGALAKELLQPYLLATLVIFSIVSFYIIFFEKSRWKIIALLVCGMNMLPYTSGDYKLLHLFLPIFLFINSPPANRLDYIYTIIFGLLLVPKNIYNLPTLPEANIGVLLNPILMLLLCVIIIFQGVRDSSRVPKFIQPSNSL